MSINLKVLFLTNVPSPYRVDFFNALGELCELTVLFETKTAKSRNEAWIADYIENFKAIYLKGIKIGEAEAFSLEVFKYLSKRKYDIIVYRNVFVANRNACNRVYEGKKNSIYS